MDRSGLTSDGRHVPAIPGSGEMAGPPPAMAYTVAVVFLQRQHDSSVSLKVPLRSVAVTAWLLRPPPRTSQVQFISDRQRTPVLRRAVLVAHRNDSPSFSGGDALHAGRRSSARVIAFGQRRQVRGQESS